MYIIIYRITTVKESIFIHHTRPYLRNKRNRIPHLKQLGTIILSTTESQNYHQNIYMYSILGAVLHLAMHSMVGFFLMRPKDIASENTQKKRNWKRNWNGLGESSLHFTLAKIVVKTLHGHWRSLFLAGGNPIHCLDSTCMHTLSTIPSQHSSRDACCFQS